MSRSRVAFTMVLAGVVAWIGIRESACTSFSASAKPDDRADAVPSAEPASAGRCDGSTCPRSCLSIKQSNAAAPSGLYGIAPDGSSSFVVYCDMTTDGGGWTVVTMNGDLNKECEHRLRRDAPACGDVANPLSDWQLPGDRQDLIPFSAVLLFAYAVPESPYAATKVDMTPDAPRTVADGVMSGTPSVIAGIPPLHCRICNFADRKWLGVSSDGYTLWGAADPTCADDAAVQGGNCAVGLNVPARDSGVHWPGWDDNNDGCGCGEQFEPSGLGEKRGYIALR